MNVLYNNPVWPLSVTYLYKVCKAQSSISESMLVLYEEFSAYNLFQEISYKIYQYSNLHISPIKNISL